MPDGGSIVEDAYAEGRQSGIEAMREAAVACLKDQAVNWRTKALLGGNIFERAEFLAKADEAASNVAALKGLKVE